MELTQGETAFELREIRKQGEEREKKLKEWVEDARREAENFKGIISAAYGSGATEDLDLFSSAIEDMSRINKEMESASDDKRAILEKELTEAERVYNEIRDKYANSEDARVRKAWEGYEERLQIASQEGAALAEIFQASLAETDKYQKGVMIL